MADSPEHTQEIPASLRERRRILADLRKAEQAQTERREAEHKQAKPGEDHHKKEPADHLIDFDDATIPPGSLGLALSGGGIRSATVCLGFVQALARRRRLLDFDYMSTVSGGGYIGSFLRSLFVPPADRGLTRGQDAPPPLPPLAMADTIRFVEKVLVCQAKVEEMPDPFNPQKKIRNPIWWLREHGRYLAPNGPTDFAFAISYLARNWIAMIYTFTVAATAVFLGLFYLEVAAKRGVPDLDIVPRITLSGQTYLVSPLIWLTPLFLFLSVAAGVAYWTTVSIRTGNDWGAKDTANPQTVFWRQWSLLAVLTLVTEILLLSCRGTSGLTDLVFWRLSWPGFLFCFGLELVFATLIIAATVAGTLGKDFSGDAFTNELRRRLTATCTLFNQLLVICVCLALIDTLALAATGLLTAWLGTNLSGLLGLSVPAAAWLIAKVPQWFAGGTAAKWIGEHIWTAALAAGSVLFGLVAIAADVLVLSVVWRDPWVESAPTLLIALFGGIVCLLFFTTGGFTRFINLSSLHNLYAGRLTRAYLGASNLERLRKAAQSAGKPITENDPGDYIDISCYQATPSAAPIHLIAATLNETESVDRSQIMDRDRKGVPLIFTPEGIMVGAGPSDDPNRTQSFPWNMVTSSRAESLSVGQLCAISGAAMSAGMGMRTTLGGAIAFTFANVRLGYWWSVRHLLRNPGSAPSTSQKVLWSLQHSLNTYRYLLCEMTALYSRENPHVYLSDGGHFENSATYELLRRKVPVIVTCDNGQDSNFEFEDLENLVRKARIDLGLSVSVAPHNDVRDLFGLDGAKLFLNGGTKDWREAARAPGGPACAVLLDVMKSSPHPSRAKGYREGHRQGYIVWVKPRLCDELPPDVVGYGGRNPTFPQQTTSDQFFDEAQWESYRAIGFCMGEILLQGTKHKIDIFRKLIPRNPP